jgi:NAD(P)-dependent dehydrogenase (short-subunit alcohol dehydrogenase family)
MARIFITGSSDGLGLMAAELLIQQGHVVVLHARNSQRADETQNKLPAAGLVVGDLASIAQTRRVADQVNKLGSFDAVIHNAAVGYREPKRIVTEDGLSHVLAVNTIAPYILTALIARPKRIVYLSSALQRDGDASLKDLTWAHRPWSGRRLTPTRSSIMCYWHLPLRDGGGVCFQTRWSLAGCPPRWAVRVRRTIWTKHIALRCGLR